MSQTTKRICQFLVCASVLTTCPLPADTTSSTLNLSRDDTPLPRQRQDTIVSYADVIEQTTPAVVSVFTAHYRKSHSHDQELRNQLRRYFGLPPETPNNAPVDNDPIFSGMGSGFLVTDDGYILTNNHVVQSRHNTLPDEIIVQLADGREFEAKLVGGDRHSDVAVLKIEAENLPYLTLGDSKGLRVGDIVFAIGNPLGLGLTVTQGIVSARDRSSLGILPGGFENFIQTDAAINRGNSGGPLVDALGRVIGINTAIISNSYQGGNIGIGYAIPIDLASDIMVNLVEGKEIQRGFIGVQLEPITRELARAFGLPSTRGAVVARVNPGLPADKAGIRHGDVILSVNNVTIESVGDVVYHISRLSPDTTASLGIMRNGQQLTIPVTLGDRDTLLGNGKPSLAVEDEPQLLRGIIAQPLTPSLREEFSLPSDLGGLLVRNVTEDSPYRRTLRPGMVILEINGHPIHSIADARKALKAPGSYNSLYLYFQGNYQYTALLRQKK